MDQTSAHMHKLSWLPCRRVSAFSPTIARNLLLSATVISSETIVLFAFSAVSTNQAREFLDKCRLPTNRLLGVIVSLGFELVWRERIAMIRCFANSLKRHSKRVLSLPLKRRQHVS